MAQMIIGGLFALFVFLGNNPAFVEWWNGVMRWWGFGPA
jgi:hypothetical protein